MAEAADEARPSAPKKRARRAGPLAFALGVIGVLTAAGYFGSFSWTLELSSHFRLQYAILAALLVPLTAWQRGRWWALAALGLAAVNAGAVVPLYFGSAPAPTSDQAPLRVLAFNVNTNNLDHQEIIAYVIESDAEITFLLEVSASLHHALEKLEGPHRLVLAEGRPDNFGVALVAKVPVEARLFPSQGIPFIEAALDHGGRRWTLLGVHPVPPVGPLLSRQRNASFDDIATWARAQSGPHLVIGDLNCTPFSPAMWQLLDDGHLVSTQPGYGYQPTWPQNAPLLWPFQIPIDHALVGGGAQATDRLLGPPIGSDHRPILVDLVAP